MIKSLDDTTKKVRAIVAELLGKLSKAATRALAAHVVDLYDSNKEDWDEGERDRLLRAMALANMTIAVHAELQAKMLRDYYADRALRKTAIAQRAGIEAAVAQQKAVPLAVDAASGD